MLQCGAQGHLSTDMDMRLPVSRAHFTRAPVAETVDALQGLRGAQRPSALLERARLRLRCPHSREVRLSIPVVAVVCLG